MYIIILFIGFYVDIPVIGTEPSLLRLYSSFSGRKALFKAAGVATPPHIKDVYSAEQLVEGLAWLVINHPFIRRWIFKMDHHSQGSGMGETNNHTLLPQHVLS